MLIWDTQSKHDGLDIVTGEFFVVDGFSKLDTTFDVNVTLCYFSHSIFLICVASVAVCIPVLEYRRTFRRRLNSGMLPSAKNGIPFNIVVTACSPTGCI